MNKLFNLVWDDRSEFYQFTMVLVMICVFVGGCMALLIQGLKYDVCDVIYQDGTVVRARHVVCESNCSFYVDGTHYMMPNEEIKEVKVIEH